MWCHWPVAPEVVARRLPPGLRPDLYEGTAWVGLVPFEMRELRVVVAGRSLPAIPTASSFSEVNVRTYVTGSQGPGVWFDTLDASSRLGSLVARAAWSLPYVSSRIDASVDDEARRCSWSIERTDAITARVSARVGASIAEPTALDVFLTERYALYARAWWNRRRALWAPVSHAPWELRACDEVGVDAALVRAAGYPVDDSPPQVRAADPVAVRIGLPQLVH